jgi:putative membrane protein
VTAPAIPELLIRHWAAFWPLNGESGLVAAIYVTASRRVHHWPWRRTGAFLAGLLAITVALESGINSYDDRLLSVHMVQHLILLEVAPVLLLCGRPMQLALRTLPSVERRNLGRALVRARRFATPAGCLTIFTAVVLGTHVPGIFDATVSDELLHDAEHLIYLLAGMVMWWPLFGDPAPSRRLGGVAALVYVTLSMLPMTLIGAYLNRDESLFYSAYAVPARELGVSPILDQQKAGAIMWVAGTTIMAWVGLAGVAASMLAAERRQRARDMREVAP